MSDTTNLHTLRMERPAVRTVPTAQLAGAGATSAIAAPPSVWMSFIAGAVGGTVAATITCPLEVLKTRLQASNTVKMRPDRLLMHIVHTEGPSALFRGLSANLLGVGPARAIYFMSYRVAKEMLDSRGVHGSGKHLLAAGLASTIQATRSCAQLGVNRFCGAPPAIPAHIRSCRPPLQ